MNFQKLVTTLPTAGLAMRKSVATIRLGVAVSNVSLSIFLSVIHHKFSVWTLLGQFCRFCRHSVVMCHPLPTAWITFLPKKGMARESKPCHQEVNLLPPVGLSLKSEVLSLPGKIIVDWRWAVWQHWLNRQALVTDFFRLTLEKGDSTQLLIHLHSQRVE